MGSEYVLDPRQSADFRSAFIRVPAADLGTESAAASVQAATRMPNSKLAHRVRAGLDWRLPGTMATPTYLFIFAGKTLTCI